MDARQAVYDAIARVSKREGELRGDQRLAEDLGIRSLARIELAALVEDAVGVTLKNADVMRAKTVEDFVALAATAKV